MTNHLYDLFTQSFPTDRTQTFLDVPGDRLWTYADLEAETARIANVLVSRGVVPGERVACQVEKSQRALFTYLATIRVGAIFLPLNPAYTKSEIDYFIGDAEPMLFVCREGRERSDVTCLTLEPDDSGSLSASADAAPDSFETLPAGDQDLAGILYTSGTTGRSKGAMLTHENLASNARTLHSYWGFRPGDVLLHALPIFHTHGLFVATNTVLVNGSSMIFLPRFDPDQVIAALPRSTVMMGVPTFYTRLLAHPGFTAETASTMRLFVSGSAPLLPQTFEEFEQRTGMRILERYGMTETNMNTSNPLDGERRAGTVGFPLPDVDLRVADGDGNALAVGEVGVIEVRGPNVFAGYWRQPEKTAAEFRPDGFFITGDMGRIDEDGYVSIVGREKDMIISGGLNVYPKEVEEIIDGLPGVIESAVIGLPHADFGEGVAAVITRAPGADLDAAKVMEALKGRLASFKLPKAVFFADELPRNTMGKVQKNALRSQFGDALKDG